MLFNNEQNKVSSKVALIVNVYSCVRVSYNLFTLALFQEDKKQISITRVEQILSNLSGY